MTPVTVCKHQPPEKCFYVPAFIYWSSHSRNSPIPKIEFAHFAVLQLIRAFA